MTTQAPSPKIIAQVSALLKNEDILAVMIGGMAMVAYGNTRMTRDCDFAAKKDEATLRRSVNAMLDGGFGVIFGWDSEHYAPTKVDFAKDVCAAWAAIDRPESIWFWHPIERVRIDLVFDLPVPMEEILARSEKFTYQGSRVLVASLEHLRIMKEKSLSDLPSRLKDEQDLVLIRYLIANKLKRLPNLPSDER